MAIHDSSSERRNLMVMSLGIIIFYIGDGTIPGSSLNLQVLSIEFNNIVALVIMLWSTFVWFLYRYWVVHRFSFGKEFPVELNEYKNAGLVRNFVESCVPKTLAPEIGKPNRKDSGIEIEWLRWRAGKINARIVEWTLNRNEEGVVTGRGRIEGGTDMVIGFTGLQGRIVTFQLLIRCLFLRPSFTSYMFPYGLALLAILLGVWDFAL